MREGVRLGFGTAGFFGGAITNLATAGYHNDLLDLATAGLTLGSVFYVSHVMKEAEYREKAMEEGLNE